jgi:peptidylprolyl isomerase
MRKLVLAALIAAAPAQAQDQTQKLSPDDVLIASSASDWQTLDPSDTLVMTLPRGPVVIRLAPEFAPNSVANIKRLVHSGYFDKAAIVRSQDNFVVQWAQDPEPPDTKGWAEFERNRTNSFLALKDRDTYAAEAGFDNGFAAASDGRREWLAHCYGVVGVGRDNAPDSGSGIELYAVTGQAPRALDRNMTVTGRVVKGMEFLSALPRGTGELGFYETASEKTPILTVKLAADLPEAQRPKLEWLKTGSPSFAAYVEARRNRGGPFYVHPAGAVDICSITPPVRAIGQ